jgi:CheY-like chemotaxis protein
VANIEPSIAGKCFLVLDDEFLIGLDIQGILETAGAGKVICAGNADDALAALRGAKGVKKIDLAVIDVKLSGATRNLSVAAALQAQGTPFVFLTAVRTHAEMKNFPNAPVVPKPYEAPVLLDAIIRMLGGR